jgi:hypothetical protein
VDPRLFQLWLSTIQQTGYERPLPEDNYLSYAYYPGQQLPSNSHGQLSSSLVYAIPGLLNTSTPNDPVFPPPDTHLQIIVTPNMTLSGQRMPEDADVTHAPDRGLPAVDTSRKEFLWIQAFPGFEAPSTGPTPDDSSIYTAPGGTKAKSRAVKKKKAKDAKQLKEAKE